MFLISLGIFSHLWSFSLKILTLLFIFFEVEPKIRNLEHGYFVGILKKLSVYLLPVYLNEVLNW